MPIESMTIKLSGKSALSRKSGVVVEQGAVLDELAKLCSNAGWTVAEIPATGELSYPLGTPVKWGVPTLPTSPIDSPTHPFVTLGLLKYFGYDPNHNRPGASDQYTRWFQWGDTPEDTILHLAGAISADGEWIGSKRITGGVLQLHIEALLPGPLFNYSVFAGDGTSGVGGGTGDGGYKLTSVEERDDLDQVVTAQYSVIAISRGFFNPTSRHITRPISFQVLQSSVTATEEVVDKYRSGELTLDSLLYDNFQTTGQGHTFNDDHDQYPSGLGYNILVNPYSFAIWCPEDSNVTSIFVAAPYIPTEEGFVSQRAVVVIYPRLGDSTFWTHAWVSLGGGPSATGNGVAFPRMMTVRSPGPNPLLTPSGAPLIIGAWIMFGGNDADQPGVVGKLWDCAMVHDTVGSGTLIGGKRYVRLAEQPGPGVARCSLVMCAPVSTVPPGFVDDPAVTTQVVSSFPVTVLLTGTSGGGVVVERLSGVQFNPGMVGLFLKFPNSGDVQYEILAFIDEDHIIAAITGWGGPTGQVFFPYIVDSVSQTTGGGTVHYRSTYGTGAVSTSPTGELTRLGWTSGNYLFDSWMLNLTIKIGGSNYTVTRVSDDGREIGFWPPFSGGPTLTNIPYQIAG